MFPNTHNRKYLCANQTAGQPKYVIDDKSHWRQTKQLKFAIELRIDCKLCFIFMFHVSCFTSHLLIPCLVARCFLVAMLAAYTSSHSTQCRVLRTTSIPCSLLPHCLRSFLFAFFIYVHSILSAHKNGHLLFTKTLSLKTKQHHKRSAKHFSLAQCAYTQTFSFLCTCIFCQDLLCCGSSCPLYCFVSHFICIFIFRSFFALFCINGCRWVDKNGSLSLSLCVYVCVCGIHMYLQNLLPLE